VSPCLLQFEKAENKPVVIGWVSAAVAAFFVAEWLIHLPALDVVSHVGRCACRKLAQSKPSIMTGSMRCLCQYLHR
jgi:type IV secretory pathway TrbD component